MKKEYKSLYELTDSRILYDKQPPAFGYLLITCLFVFMIIVIIFSKTTKKTTVITIRGMVESNDKSYVMSVYSGEVKTVFVEEGSLVEKGDPLLLLTNQQMEQDIHQYEVQQMIYKKNIDQYERLIQSVEDGVNYFDKENSEDNMYYYQYEAYQNKIAKYEIDSKEYISMGYTKEQIEALQENAQTQRMDEYYQYIQSIYEKLEEYQIQISLIDKKLNDLKETKESYCIRANTSGTVHFLTVCNEGMLVQSGTTIASVSPSQELYDVISYISPEDLPRIGIGSAANVSISGLPTSVYGTVKGYVTSIDSDLTMGQGQDSQQPQTFFKVRIQLEDSYLVGSDGTIKSITVGMSVNASIICDSITYFDYIRESLGGVAR